MKETIHNESIKTARFYFCNLLFPYYHDLIICFDNFRIHLKPHEKALFFHKELLEKGGVRPTFTGEITKEDGSGFSLIEMNAILKDMRYFFGFLIGIHCSATDMTIELYNVDGSKYKLGYPPTIDKGSSLRFSGWLLDPAVNFKSFFVSIYDGIAKFGEGITFPIYWYIAANTIIQQDAGLILAQSALERLTHFVEQKNPKEYLSKKEGDSASKRIKAMLLVCGISVAIPNELSILRNVVSKDDKTSGPFSITEVRNVLVHPNPENDKYQDYISEAKALAMDYIERVILKLCDYDYEKHGYYGEIQKFLKRKLNKEKQIKVESKRDNKKYFQIT